MSTRRLTRMDAIVRNKRALDNKLGRRLQIETPNCCFLKVVSKNHIEIEFVFLKWRNKTLEYTQHYLCLLNVGDSFRPLQLQQKNLNSFSQSVLVKCVRSLINAAAYRHLLGNYVISRLRRRLPHRRSRSQRYNKIKHMT
jgi:hypothetical protein